MEYPELYDLILDKIKSNGTHSITGSVLQEVCLDLLDFANTHGGDTPDWSENDPDAPGYVRNRPCYKEETSETISIGSPETKIAPVFTAAGQKFFGVIFADSRPLDPQDPSSDFEERTVNLVKALPYCYNPRQHNGFVNAFQGIQYWKTDSNTNATVKGPTMFYFELILGEDGDNPSYTFNYTAYSCITIRNPYYYNPSDPTTPNPWNVAVVLRTTPFDTIQEEMDAWTLENYQFRIDPSGNYNFIDADGNPADPSEEALAASSDKLYSLLADYLVPTIGGMTVELRNNYFPDQSISIYLNTSESYRNAFDFAPSTIEHQRDYDHIQISHVNAISRDDVLYDLDGAAAFICPGIDMFYDYDSSETSSDIMGYSQEEVNAWQTICASKTLADFGIDIIDTKTEIITTYHTLDPNFLPEGSGGGGAKQTLVFGPNMTFDLGDDNTWVNGTAAQVAAALDISEEDLEKLVTFQYDFVEFSGPLTSVLDVSVGPIDWFKADGEFKNVGVVLGWDKYVFNANSNVISAVNDLIAGNTPSAIPYMPLACVVKRVDKNGNVEYGVYDYND